MEFMAGPPTDALRAVSAAWMRRFDVMTMTTQTILHAQRSAYAMQYMRVWGLPVDEPKVGARIEGARCQLAHGAAHKGQREREPERE